MNAKDKPENENKERDLAMFREFLSGKTYEELASKHDLSLSRVYAIAKRYGWGKYKDRDVKREMLKIAEEVDREKEDPRRNFVEHNGQLGEWLENTIRFPKGVKRFGVFPHTNPNVKILEENYEEGYIRQTVFFPGGYKNPFSKLRSRND